mgnify:CR=1 FL=1
MVILSNDYFQQRFGGDQSVIGKPLPVAAAFGPPPIIVGVLAPGFELLFPPQANMEQFPSIWIAARIPYDVANRNNVQWRVIGPILLAACACACAAEDSCERNIEASAWDGQWYRRAYFDDGTPLGSHANDECKIDSLAQSWAVLSGAVPLRFADRRVKGPVPVTRVETGVRRGELSRRRGTARDGAVIAGIRAEAPGLRYGVRLSATDG